MHQNLWVWTGATRCDLTASLAQGKVRVSQKPNPLPLPRPTTALRQHVARHSDQCTSARQRPPQASTCPSWGGVFTCIEGGVFGVYSGCIRVYSTLFLVAGVSVFPRFQSSGGGVFTATGPTLYNTKRGRGIRPSPFLEF